MLAGWVAGRHGSIALAVVTGLLAWVSVYHYYAARVAIPLAFVALVAGAQRSRRPRSRCTRVDDPAEARASTQRCAASHGNCQGAPAHVDGERSVKGTLLTDYARCLSADAYEEFLQRHRECLLAGLEDTRPYLFTFKRLFIILAPR
jgi:hypothetical protein